MARAHRLGAIAAIFTIAYTLALYALFPIPFVAPEVVQLLLPVIPWWLLVAFGAYSLSSLGLGLLTFRDCPDAYKELLDEIQEAKNDLRAKGVSVD